MKLLKISRKLEGDGSCEECQEENINVPDEASENLVIEEDANLAALCFLSLKFLHVHLF